MISIQENPKVLGKSFCKYQKQMVFDLPGKWQDSWYNFSFIKNGVEYVPVYMEGVGRVFGDNTHGEVNPVWKITEQGPYYNFGFDFFEDAEVGDRFVWEWEYEEEEEEKEKEKEEEGL